MNKIKTWIKNTKLGKRAFIIEKRLGIIKTKTNWKRLGIIETKINRKRSSKLNLNWKC